MKELNEFIGKKIEEFENVFKVIIGEDKMNDFLIKNSLNKNSIFNKKLSEQFIVFLDTINLKSNIRGGKSALIREYSFPISTKLNILIDKGSASNEEIAELVSKINKLYRLFGGNGINFINEDTSILTLNFAE